MASSPPSSDWIPCSPKGEQHNRTFRNFKATPNCHRNTPSPDSSITTYSNFASLANLSQFESPVIAQVPKPLANLDTPLVPARPIKTEMDSDSQCPDNFDEQKFSSVNGDITTELPLSPGRCDTFAPCQGLKQEFKPNLKKDPEETIFIFDHMSNNGSVVPAPAQGELFKITKSESSIVNQIHVRNITSSPPASDFIDCNPNAEFSNWTICDVKTMENPHCTNDTHYSLGSSRPTCVIVPNELVDVFPDNLDEQKSFANDDIATDMPSCRDNSQVIAPVPKPYANLDTDLVPVRLIKTEKDSDSENFPKNNSLGSSHHVCAIVPQANLDTNLVPLRHITHIKTRSPMVELPGNVKIGISADMFPGQIKSEHGSSDGEMDLNPDGIQATDLTVHVPRTEVVEQEQPVDWVTLPAYRKLVSVVNNRENQVAEGINTPSLCGGSDLVNNPGSALTPGVDVDDNCHKNSQSPNKSRPVDNICPRSQKENLQLSPGSNINSGSESDSSRGSLQRPRNGTSSDDGDISVSFQSRYITFLSNSGNRQRARSPRSQRGILQMSPELNIEPASDSDMPDEILNYSSDETSPDESGTPHIPQSRYCDNLTYRRNAPRRPNTQQSRRGACYTDVEETNIVKYIVERHAYKNIKGKTIWVEMERDQVCPERTWQSLKERFLKYTMKHIRKFTTSENQVEMFRQGMCRPRNAADDRRRGSSTKKYSMKENRVIIDYVISDHRYKLVGGNSMWKEMEEKQPLPGRTWQSMKEHYRRVLVHNLSGFGITQLEAAALRSYCPGPYNAE